MTLDDDFRILKIIDLKFLQKYDKFIIKPYGVVYEFIGTDGDFYLYKSTEGRRAIYKKSWWKAKQVGAIEFL